MKIWFEHRKEIVASKRARRTALFLLLFVAIFVVPWRSVVKAPAMATPVRQTAIHALAPSVIVDVKAHEGAAVAKGDLLFVVRSPEIEHDLERAEISASLIRMKLARGASDATDRQASAVLMRALRSEEARINGLRALVEEGEIRAPHDGVVADLAHGLHAGQWINEAERLAKVIDPSAFELVILAPESAVERIKIGAKARFSPDELFAGGTNGAVSRIGATSLEIIDEPVFASTFGGRIAVRSDADGELVPDEAVLEIRAELTAAPDAGRAVTGVASIEARPESIGRAVWRRIAGVLIRETDF